MNHVAKSGVIVHECSHQSGSMMVSLSPGLWSIGRPVKLIGLFFMAFSVVRLIWGGGLPNPHLLHTNPLHGLHGLICGCLPPRERQQASWWFKRTLGLKHTWFDRAKTPQNNVLTNHANTCMLIRWMTMFMSTNDSIRPRLDSTNCGCQKQSLVLTQNNHMFVARNDYEDISKQSILHL